VKKRGRGRNPRDLEVTFISLKIKKVTNLKESHRKKKKKRGVAKERRTWGKERAVGGTGGVSETGSRTACALLKNLNIMPETGSRKREKDGPPIDRLKVNERQGSTRGKKPGETKNGHMTS